MSWRDTAIFSESQQNSKIVASTAPELLATGWLPPKKWETAAFPEYDRSGSPLMTRLSHLWTVSKLSKRANWRVSCCRRVLLPHWRSISLFCNAVWLFLSSRVVASSSLNFPSIAVSTLSPIKGASTAASAVITFESVIAFYQVLRLNPHHSRCIKLWNWKLQKILGVSFTLNNNLKTNKKESW